MTRVHVHVGRPRESSTERARRSYWARKALAAYDGSGFALDDVLRRAWKADVPGYPTRRIMSPALAGVRVSMGPGGSFDEIVNLASTLPGLEHLSAIYHSPLWQFAAGRGLCEKCFYSMPTEAVREYLHARALVRVTTAYRCHESFRADGAAVDINRVPRQRVSRMSAAVNASEFLEASDLDIVDRLWGVSLIMIESGAAKRTDVVAAVGEAAYDFASGEEFVSAFERFAPKFRDEWLNAVHVAAAAHVFSSATVPDSAAVGARIMKKAERARAIARARRRGDDERGGVTIVSHYLGGSFRSVGVDEVLT